MYFIYVGGHADTSKIHKIISLIVNVDHFNEGINKELISLSSPESLFNFIDKYSFVFEPFKIKVQENKYREPLITYNGNVLSYYNTEAKRFFPVGK